MIPSSRLITATALLVPLGLLPALAPQWNLLGLLLVAMALAVAVADLALSAGRLQGIELSLPKVNRLSHNRQGTISLTIHGQQQQRFALQLGLDLDPDFVGDDDIISCLAPAQGTSLSLAWPVLAKARGRFQLQRAVLATRSRFGLWQLRRWLPLQAEIRVYPDLLSERKHLAALFLSHMRDGSRARRQIGQGRDFEKLREYIPGDSLDQIHWKATAKRNIPMSKLYQVERTQEVYVLIDSSRLSGVAVQNLDGNEESQLELFMKAALVTGLVAQQQGDLYGLCTFSNKVDTFLRAKGGKNHFNSCRDQLFMLDSKAVSPDYRELAAFLRQRLRKRALLIILTNLDDPVLAEEFVASMELINRQHLVLVMAINPSWTQPLFGPGEVESVEDIHRHLAGHLQDQALQTLAKKLHSHGVRLFRPSPEKLSVAMVREYGAVKDRQLL